MKELLIYCVIDSMLIGFAIITGHYYKKEIKALDKNHYPSRNVMGIGLFIYDNTVLFKKKNKIASAMLEIYGKINYQERTRLFIGEKVAAIYAVMTLSVILATVLNISNLQLKEIDRIEKPNYGEGAMQQEISYEMALEKEAIGKNIMVSIPEKTPSKEEVDEAFKIAAVALEKVILGENQSLNHVTSNLNLIKKYEQYGISIVWESSNKSVLLDDGKVINNKITEEKKVTLRVTMSYEKYLYEGNYQIIILPKILGEQEQIQRVEMNLEEVIEEQGSNEKDYIVLPQVLDNTKNIKWFNQGKLIAPFKIIIVGISLMVIVYILFDTRLERRAKNRQKEILNEFPNLANKFILLINAGMNFNRAWQKISEDYMNRVANDGNRKIIYEEMLITNDKIANGASVIEAYIAFGQRCKVLEVQRFITNVIQNIKKGGDQLVSVLKQQAKESADIRKNEARMAGEKASTRLVLPMAIMLIAIMLLIITPIFMSIAM